MTAKKRPIGPPGHGRPSRRLYMPRLRRGQHCLPHCVGNFGMSDVAMRTGETIAMLDDCARLEVVHASFLEPVVERRRLHLEIFGTSISEALNAERPDAAVLGELCRCKHELILEASSFGIEASNSCVERGSRRNHRTTHESILDDA